MLRMSPVLGLLLCAIVVRQGIAAPQTDVDLVPKQEAIVEAGPSLSPFQHVRFCQRYPADCRPSPRTDPFVDAAAKNLGLLGRINRQVNAEIVPMRKSANSDSASSWVIAPKAGDCNDYAVTKQHELLRRGYSSSAVRLSVVKTADGVGHLVLLVATLRGDVVLDNLTDEIRPWNDTNYRWVKVQSKTNPNYWVEVSSPVIIPATIREIFKKIAAVPAK